MKNNKGFIETVLLIGASLALLAAGYFMSQTQPETPKNDFGATVLKSFQVGTSPQNGYYLQTDGINSSWQPVVGGGGSGGGTWATTTSTHANRLINYPNNVTDIVVIGGTATTTGFEYYFDPNTQTAQIGTSNTASTTIMGNATTTGRLSASYFDASGAGTSTFAGAIEMINPYFLTTHGIRGNASGGLSIVANNYTAVANLGTGNSSNATFYGGVNIDGNTRLATSLTGLAKLTSGTVSTASAGTDYEVPVTAGDGLTRTANDFDCDTASGSVFGCLTSTDWTTFNNKVGTSRSLTVAGTANQITSSAGAQDLSADRTWTLSFPNQIIFPQYASSTLGFSTPYASSTFQTIGTLTFGGVTGSAWSSFCTSITGSADLCDGSDASGAGGSSAYEMATTSDIALSQLAYIAKTSGRTTLASVATSSLAVGSSLSSSGTLGSQVGGTNSTLSLNLANPNTWTVNQTFNYSSSTAYSSFVNASTTNLIVNGQSFNDLTGDGLTLSSGALTVFNVPASSLASADFGDFTCNGVSCLIDASAVSLTTDVSGTLPIANGGTATTTGRYQGIYFFGGDTFRQASTTGLLDYDPTRQLFTTKYSSSTDYASFNIASTTFLRVGLADGCLNVTSGLVGSTGSACGSGGGGSDPFSHTLFGGQAGGNFYSATTSMMAIGTSTAPNNLSALTISSSTASQLALSAGANNPMWTMRNAGGNFYISTTTTAGTATSTLSALTILNNGNVGVGTNTPSSAFNVIGTTTLSARTGHQPYLLISTTTPIYPYSHQYLADIGGSMNDFMAVNIFNNSNGNCATADLSLNNDLADIVADFLDIGHTSSGYTGVGCSALSLPMPGLQGNSSYMVDPSGSMSFLIGSTSPNVRFNWFTGGYAASNEKMRLDYIGRLLHGTTTQPGMFGVTIASSTAPQLSLSAGAGIAQWTMRNAGGNLYFSTTTVAGTATTSTAALSLFGSGVPSLVIGTSTPSSVSNGMLVLGTGAANASTTIQMGKIQFDGYNSAGTRQCVMWSGGAWTSVNGACQQ